MLNKLTFPEGGTETRYLWNKHQINYDGEYVWSKYQILTINHHTWEKYIANNSEFFEWKKYSAISAGDGTYTRGNYIETIQVEDDTQLPQVGYQDGYWYERVGTYYWQQYKANITHYEYELYKYNLLYYQTLTNVKKYSLRRGINITGFKGLSYLGDVSVYIKEYGTESHFLYLEEYRANEVDRNRYAKATYPIKSNSIWDGPQMDDPNYLTHLIGQKVWDYSDCFGIFSPAGYVYVFTADTTFEKSSASNPDYYFTNCKRYKTTTTSIPNNGRLNWGVNNLSINYPTSELWIEDFPYFNELISTGPLTRTEENSLFIDNFGKKYPDSAQDVDIWDSYLYNPIIIGNCYKDGQYGYYISYKSRADEPSSKPVSARQDAVYEIGDYIQNVKGSSSMYSPKDFPSGSQYYKYVGNIYGKGTLIGQVEGYDSQAYPASGVYEDKWYEYETFSATQITKGDYVEDITVDDVRDAYPDDYYSGNYWYVFKNTEVEKRAGEFVEVVRDEENNYPENGINYLDNHWYIYEEFDENGPFKSKYTSGTVNSNVRSDYPDDAIQGNYWYDYQYDYIDYICHIYNDKIKGGVKYKQDVNPEADYTVGCVASAEVTFDYDNSLDDFQKYIDYGYFDYFIQQPNDNYEWRLIGRFWLDDVKYKRKTASIKAYDAIVAKDIYIDEFIKQTTFPISLTNFFHSLCEFCGVVGVIKGNLANRNFAFADNFQAINITARQIFQYIAEMAGGFIHVNAEGQVELTTYSATGTALDNTQYVSYDKSKYNTHEISGLTVKVNTDDLGVSTGDIETNRYIVENNPLFYCQSENEISGAVSALNNALKGKIYTPAKIELLQDFGINCGDIITVNGDTVYVMKKNITASGVTLECVGQEYRDKEPTSINSDIIALRGKTNELYRDLEQTRSTITDVEAGLRSEITQTAERLTSEFTAKDNETGEDLKSLISQTAEEIRMEVSRTNSETEETLRSEYQQTAENITLTVENQGKSISSLELRADSITSSVSNVQGEMSEIKQTANSIESRVQGVEGQVSSIRQDLDGIDLSYSSSNGTASITVGNITVKVPSEDGVEDLVEERVGIEMNGYVQFVDLEEEGETVIHGGNVTTGKVNADYLGLYGLMNVRQRYNGTKYEGNGGYIGYALGDDGVNGATEGIAVSAPAKYSYFIATNSGARLTCYDTRLVVMDGQISANEAIGSGSDERVKNTINHDLDRYEEFYKDLKPAYYKYNHGTSDRYHTGFIAQEVEEAINNNGITNQDFAGLIQIKGDADGILGAEYQDQYYLRYEEFIALNTYMIQKLMKRIDELEAEVNTLKGE